MIRARSADMLSILRKLRYGRFSIHSDYGGGMRANLLENPAPPGTVRR